MRLAYPHGAPSSAWLVHGAIDIDIDIGIGIHVDLDASSTGGGTPLKRSPAPERRRRLQAKDTVRTRCASSIGDVSLPMDTTLLLGGTLCLQTLAQKAASG